MRAGNKATLVLCDRRWFPIRTQYVLIFGLILLIAPIALLYFANLYIFPDVPWAELQARLLSKLATTDWLNVLFKRLDILVMTILLAGQIIYLFRAQKLERLTLSSAGIQYTSPLPEMLKRIKPDWYMRWDQLKKIELGTLYGTARHPNFVLMTFTSATEKHRIRPGLWIDPKNYPQPKFHFSLKHASMTQSNEEVLKSVMESEVAVYISAVVPNITIDSALAQAVTQTSLEKNPHGRISIAIIFLLIIYSVIDFVIEPESYVDNPANFAYFYIAAGIVGAAVSAIWLYRSTLVNAEKAGLALLIGVLVSVAMVPGALRINALTDSRGPVKYDYYVIQSSDGVVLRPLVEGMPVIDYFAHNKFWNKFGNDETYQVLIRKGGLGFYQFNSSTIVDEIQHFDKQ